MIAKTNERSKAILLRKSGKTIPDIAQTLHVSKSSVSLWLRDIVLPEKARASISARRAQSRLCASETRRSTTQIKLKNADMEAGEFLKTYKVDSGTALIVCAVMYWCEGSKSKNDSEFTFTNSDPTTIAAFLTLLRNAFPIDETRIRIKMHLHRYHDEYAQKDFWSRTTGVPIAQFQGTYWKNNSGINKKANYPGCVQIRYHDVEVARKISAVARNFLSCINMVK